MQPLSTKKPFLLFILPLLIIPFILIQQFSPQAAAALHKGKNWIGSTFTELSASGFGKSHAIRSFFQQFNFSDQPAALPLPASKTYIPYRLYQSDAPTLNSINKFRPAPGKKSHRDFLIREENRSPQAQALEQAHYEQLITVVQNRRSLLPFRNLDTLTFATLAMGGRTGNEFQQYLRKYVPLHQFAIPAMQTKRQTYQTMLKQLEAYQVVIISLHQITPTPLTAFGIPLVARTFIERLRSRTQVVLVAFGTPFSLKYFDRLPHLVCAFDDNLTTQRLVPQILFGALPATGRLPVHVNRTLQAGSGVDTPSLKRLGYSVPERVGMASETLQQIDRMVNKYIRKKAMPGAQVLVAKNGKVIYEKSFGYLTYNRQVPVTTHTIYDLASVTKVAATLQAVMHLASEGTLDINRKASHYLPELKGTNKEHIVIRDLLLHQAGLLTFQNHWTYTKTAAGPDPRYYTSQPDPQHPLEVAPELYGIASLQDSIWQWTLRSRLLKKRLPNNKFGLKYSDIGFDMLQRIVEQLAEAPLDEYLARSFYRPLGLNELTFNPLHKFDSRRIAPTENDTRFRGIQLRGTVHDQQAALMGGVAGHAGLFGTANDLAALMQMNLQKGYYGGRQFFTENTVPDFTRTYANNNPRGLGWDRALPEGGGSVSDLASRNTFGHTGFTGTCVWIDPDEQIVYIFLSNRVYPDVKNTRLARYKVRQNIQDLIYKALSTNTKLMANIRQ